MEKYAGYKINIKEIKKLEVQDRINQNNSIQENLKKFLLEEFKINEDEINGDKIVEKNFPNKENYEVFISHSHNDKEYAQKLSNFLRKRNCKVFLDSEVWGSADEILKEVDNEYSVSDSDKNLYDYTKRNFSTTHVHLLLTSALAEIISKTPRFIFVESDSTISFSMEESKKKTYTNSPWVYTELLLFKLFSQNGIYGIYNESHNDYNIKRNINLKFLKNLTKENIEEILKLKKEI